MKTTKDFTAFRIFLRRLGVVLFMASLFTMTVAQTFYLEQLHAIHTEEIPMLGIYICWAMMGVNFLGMLLVGCNISAGVRE